MKSNFVKVLWPNGKISISRIGDEWITEAKKMGISIPTGCLLGKCGACEIEVNGKIIRSCINRIDSNKNKPLRVDFYYDPYW